MEAEGLETELERTDWKIVNSWLGMLYPELHDPGTYQTMISYVNPDKLTEVYERREQALDDFLENSGQVGKEKEYLLHMEQKVEKPLRYQWVEGWSQLLGSMVADLGAVMALFLAIALSSLFAGEWHDNTSSLVLTTKNGWKNIAFTKVLTGFVFVIEFFAILAIPNILSQIFFMGTTGWDLPIQNIKLIAVARFHPQKSLDRLIRAVHYAKTEGRRLQLVLIGGGSLEDELKSLCTQLNCDDVIQFQGYSSNPYPAIKEADCFVLSSLYEGYPTIVLESFLSTTPVLACDVAGVGEQILEEHQGWIIENSQEALNQSLIMLCDNLPLLQKYKVKLETYESENAEILRRLEEIFREN